MSPEGRATCDDCVIRELCIVRRELLPEYSEKQGVMEARERVAILLRLICRFSK